MKNRIVFLIFLVFPLILFGGEKLWNGKNVRFIRVKANGCYIVVTTDRNPNSVLIKYTLPEELVKMEKKKDSLEINVGKTVVNDSSDVINLKINKQVVKKDTVYINLSPRKTCDLKFQFGVVKAKINFGNARFRNLSLESGVSDVTMDFTRAKRINLNKIGISGGVSKLNIKKLLNSGADTVSIEGGVSKQIIDLSGKLKNSMYLNMDLGMSMTTVSFDNKLPMRIERNDEVISSTTMPDNFVEKENGIYESKNFNNRKMFIDIKIDNSIGGLDFIEK
ncbi:MAG: hypothetical protein GWP03_03245 [Proteobacteria bacterium]|nr:hypothetical protein [Pseudomonadota bacterium]